MATDRKPQCKHLILDAGPLLSLTPLRGLSEAFYTVPQVLAELKDRRAREHLEQLATHAGVKIAIKSPDAESLAYGTSLLSLFIVHTLITLSSYTMGKENRRL